MVVLTKMALSSSKRPLDEGGGGQVAVGGGGGGAVPHQDKKVSTLESKKEEEEILDFVAWNMNSYKARIENNNFSVTSWLESLDRRPDIVVCTETFIKGKPSQPGEILIESEAKTPSSISRPVPGYSRHCSNNTERCSSGCMVLIRNECEVPSFVGFTFKDTYQHLFGEDKAPPPIFKGAVRYGHTDDGRVIFLEFNDLILICTYWPNLGSDTARRENLDADLKCFAKKCKESKRDLIIIGDLNIAPHDNDVSHPSEFNVPSFKFHKGYSLLERDRFKSLLLEADAVDFFHESHKDRFDPKEGDFRRLEKANYTWRGAPGSSNSNYAMRLDHVVGSKALFDSRFESMEILGTSAESFMGSDHCPIRLRLKSKPK